MAKCAARCSWTSGLNTVGQEGVNVADSCSVCYAKNAKEDSDGGKLHSVWITIETLLESHLETQQQISGMPNETLVAKSSLPSMILR